MWLIVGFAALGLLVGNLVGLTAHSVVSSVLSWLFAFMGTSIIALLSKLNAADRKLSGQCVFALSLCCLLGTYSGISISEWHLLSPREERSAIPAGTGHVDQPRSLRNKYLNADTISAIDGIDTEYRNKAIGGDEAYERLRTVVQNAH